MALCRVCTHPQMAAIEADLAHGSRPRWGELGKKYGLPHVALMNHARDHMLHTIATLAPAPDAGAVVETPPAPVGVDASGAGAPPWSPEEEDSVDRLLRQLVPPLQRAWRLAGEDQATQQHILDRLNRALEEA